MKHDSIVIEKEVVALCKRKSVALMVPCKKKKINTIIIKSDYDDDNDDDKNFLASCDKALRRDPLDI